MTLEQMETIALDLQERVSALERDGGGDSIAVPNNYYITNSVTNQPEVVNKVQSESFYQQAATELTLPQEGMGHLLEPITVNIESAGGFAYIAAGVQIEQSHGGTSFGSVGVNVAIRLDNTLIPYFNQGAKKHFLRRNALHGSNAISLVTFRTATTTTAEAEAEANDGGSGFLVSEGGEQGMSLAPAFAGNVIGIAIPAGEHTISFDAEGTGKELNEKAELLNRYLAFAREWSVVVFG